MIEKDEDPLRVHQGVEVVILQRRTQDRISVGEADQMGPMDQTMMMNKYSMVTMFLLLKKLLRI
jgi:hypothetical protein